MPAAGRVRAYLRRFFCATDVPPRDFEQVVKVVLATFAVFTGFVFSSYLGSELPLAEFSGWFGWIVWLDEWRFWAFFALMALLLRYIVGSAVHLTFMYVPVKTADGKPPRSRSNSVVFLFKDLVFLVIFGLVAMSIATAAKPVTGNVDTFAQRAMLFVGAGFVWSLLDAALRGLWGLRWRHEGPGCFWMVWAVLDLGHWCMLWWILKSGSSPLHKAELLALVNVVFLLLDIAAVIRAVQVHDDPPPGDGGRAVAA